MTIAVVAIVSFVAGMLLDGIIREIAYARKPHK